jgi:hypothetical protein
MANTLFNNLESVRVQVGGSGTIGGNPASNSTIVLSNAASGKRRISEMDDVNDADTVSGYTLLYNANTSTYDLVPLNLDGGGF